MGVKEVCRYLELLDRRMYIVLHSGIDWKPEYEPELEAIDNELAELRILVEQAHEQREAASIEQLPQSAVEEGSTTVQANEQEMTDESMLGGMREFRVRFWHQDEDGREDFMEFDTLEQAQEFYSSLDGMAEIQEWDEKWGRYWTVQGPEFEI